MSRETQLQTCVERVLRKHKCISIEIQDCVIEPRYGIIWVIIKYSNKAEKCLSITCRAYDDCANCQPGYHSPADVLTFKKLYKSLKRKGFFNE